MIVWKTEKRRVSARVNGYEVTIEETDDELYRYRLLIEGVPRQPRDGLRSHLVSAKSEAVNYVMKLRFKPR